MNWRQISRNPVDVGVHKFLLKTLKQKKTTAPSSVDFIKHFVEGKSVLDIGAVEHDMTHIRSDKWMHRKLKAWARELVGIDILEDEVRVLNELGFDVRLVDATSSVDLGKTFERIVIGDVLEHVSNPIELLKFCQRHLTDDGMIMATTPNPFCYFFFLRVIKEGTFIANGEHISWIGPTMAIEIANRAGVQLKSYHPVISRPKSAIKRILKKMLTLFISEDNEIYAVSYIYLFAK